MIQNHTPKGKIGDEVVKILSDLFFPPKCAFCGKLMDTAGDGVCPACAAALPAREDENALLLIGEKLYPCAVAFYYESPVKEGVHALKFGGKPWRARIFARYIVQTAAEQLSGRFDAVTYVPVSPQRNFRRGYDQARLLAQAAGRAWGVPAETTLRKIRHNRAQSSLKDPGQRKQNVKHAYAVPHPGRVAGRRFLLIDDVATTGSTLSACADALLSAGAASVVCAALAGGRRAAPPCGAGKDCQVEKFLEN